MKEWEKSGGKMYSERIDLDCWKGFKGFLANLKLNSYKNT